MQFKCLEANYIYTARLSTQHASYQCTVFFIHFIIFLVIFAHPLHYSILNYLLPFAVFCKMPATDQLNEVDPCGLMMKLEEESDDVLQSKLAPESAPI